MCATVWALESEECNFELRLSLHMFDASNTLPGTVGGSTMLEVGEWLSLFKYDPSLSDANLQC
jgi:hypothetical protein